MWLALRGATCVIVSVTMIHCAPQAIPAEHCCSIQPSMLLLVPKWQSRLAAPHFVYAPPCLWPPQGRGGGSREGKGTPCYCRLLALPDLSIVAIPMPSVKVPWALSPWPSPSLAQSGWVAGKGQQASCRHVCMLTNARRCMLYL